MQEGSPAFIVIDYNRSKLPIEDSVTVPFFPQPGDMVEIQGENDEIWLGHIQRVNCINARSTVF